MTFTIRPLTHADRSQWDQLWQGYLAFYESAVPDDVSDLTWQRILDPEAPIHAFCAAQPDGKLLGIVHYLFHPVTWAAGPRCYLEDLFTASEARGQGVGRALIEAVYAAADARCADQVYWLTQDTNATARRLYDQVARATPFIKYRR
jgi:GNAT superfamily N-acetyltransferase